MTTADMLDQVISSHREGSDRVRAFAYIALEESPTCEQVRDGICTVEQAEQFRLADMLKGWIELEIDDMSLDTFQGCVRAQLARCAFEDVDWDDLACHYLQRVKDNDAI